MSRMRGLGLLPVCLVLSGCVDSLVDVRAVEPPPEFSVQVELEEAARAGPNAVRELRWDGALLKIQDAGNGIWKAPLPGRPVPGSVYRLEVVTDRWRHVCEVATPRKPEGGGSQIQVMIGECSTLEAMFHVTRCCILLPFLWPWM